MGAEDEYIRLAQETDLMPRILDNTQRMIEIGRSSKRNLSVINELNQVFTAMRSSGSRLSQHNSQPWLANGAHRAASNRALGMSQAGNNPAERVNVHERLDSQANRGEMFDRLDGGINGNNRREGSHVVSSQQRSRITGQPNDREQSQRSRSPRDHVEASQERSNLPKGHEHGVVNQRARGVDEQSFNPDEIRDLRHQLA